jgi:hypothetical protein
MESGQEEPRGWQKRPVRYSPPDGIAVIGRSDRNRADRRQCPSTITRLADMMIAEGLWLRKRDELSASAQLSG